MIDTITATRVRCDHTDGDDCCDSYVASDGLLAPDAARRAAAERGWYAEPDRQLCPKHRRADTP